MVACDEGLPNSQLICRYTFVVRIENPRKCGNPIHKISVRMDLVIRLAFSVPLARSPVVPALPPILLHAYSVECVIQCSVFPAISNCSLVIANLVRGMSHIQLASMDPLNFL